MPSGILVRWDVVFVLGDRMALHYNTGVLTCQPCSQRGLVNISTKSRALILLSNVHLHQPPPTPPSPPLPPIDVKNHY